jgi:hypothetical protein
MSRRGPGNRAGASGRKSADSPATATGHTTFEPTVGRLLLRLLVEAIEIAFIVGLKWALDGWLRYTHLEHEWWARILMSSAALYAVLTFVVIAGAETISDCLLAVRSAWRRLREG